VAKRWDLVAALLQHGEDAGDHNLPLLYWFAAEPLVPADPARALALAGQTPLTVVRGFLAQRQAALAEASSAAKPGSDGITPLLTALADTHDAAYQRELLAAILSATEGKTGLRPPEGWRALYSQLSTSADLQVIALADTVAVRFGDTGVHWSKLSVLRDPLAPLPTRLAAFMVVQQRHDFQLAPVYQKLLMEPALRVPALQALSAYDVASTPPTVLAAYGTFPADAKQAALALLSGRPAYARELLAAVAAGTVPRADLDATVTRQLRLLKDPAVDDALAALGGVTREFAATTAQEIAHWREVLTPARLTAADPVRGRAVFRQTCALCHTLFGEGKHLGPDLTGSNRADLDYVLANVVDPNAVIGKDYLLNIVETTDGRTLAGLVQRETPSTVTLVNQAESVTLPRDAIKQLQPQEISLMPAGLLQSLSEQEVADLVRYLRQPSPLAP
jgi:putative heme-binding domain-containing protein